MAKRLASAGKEEKNLRLAPLCTGWSLGEVKCQGLFHRTLEAPRSGEAQGHSTRGQGLWTGGLEPGSSAVFADSIPVLFCLLPGPAHMPHPVQSCGFWGFGAGEAGSPGSAWGWCQAPPGGLFSALGS